MDVCLSTLLTTLWFTSVSAEEGSIAVNKPAYQSSTYDECSAGAAVDNNTHSNYITPPYCAFTYPVDGPAWWIVDLQALYTVTHVKFYANNHGTQSSNKVQGFLESPALCKSAVGQDCFTLVKAHSGIIQPCVNNVTARYIRVSNPSYVRLCEIDVFGVLVESTTCPGCMVNPVTITADYKITDPNSHTIDAQNRLSCTIQCQKLKGCFVYSFKKGTGECVLTTSPPESRYVVSSPGWETYKICPRHVAACHAGIH